MSGSASERQLSICVIGAGGIGSVVAGCLCDAGHNVVLCDPWFEHIDAINAKGLAVNFADGAALLARPKAVHFKDLQSLPYGGFDLGFVAVNAYDASWAAAALDRFVKREGKLCVFCNGLCDERVAAVAGDERTLGVVMTISAAVYTPGVAMRTDRNAHAFKVGRLDGKRSSAAAELAEALRAVGPSDVTCELARERWSKLMLNTMNNALAGLTGWKTAECRTHYDTQRIGIQLAAEAVRVGKCLYGPELPDVLGLQPQDILDAASSSGGLGPAQKQLEHLAATAGSESRPSFAQDVLKGRRTEIDELNGVVARKGREVNVPTPFCDKIVAIVNGLGVGFRPDPSLIRPLLEMLPRGGALD